MARFLTASRIRRTGFLIALESLAFASWLSGWRVSFLVGLLVLGIGMGLWDWGGRRWS